MNIWDFLILALIAVCAVAAFRLSRKGGRSCTGCCAACSQACAEKARRKGSV